MTWLPAILAALMCPQCGHLLDCRAKICPKCGREVHKLRGSTEGAITAIVVLFVFFILMPLLWIF